MDTDEILISRIVDRDDRPEDWVELDRIAARDPGAWDRLVTGLRHAAALRAAGAELLDGLERIEAPVRPRPRRIGRVLRWSAVAASLIVAVWFGLTGSGSDGTAGRTSDPDARRPAVAPDRPAAAPPPEGRLVRELTPVMLRSRPASDGEGVEVLYLRRLIERHVVPSLYGIGRDEYGRPVLHPKSPEVWNLTSL